MKTTILKQIGMIMLLVAITGFAANAQKNKNGLEPFYHSCRGVKDLTPTQIICKPDDSGKYLKPYRKYVFTYDAQERVTKKEAYQWNTRRREWMPNHVLSYTYTNELVEIELAAWNKKLKSFSPAKEKVVYTSTHEGIASYTCYKRNHTTEDWEIITRLSDLTPNRLIAGK